MKLRNGCEKLLNSSIHNSSVRQWIYIRASSSPTKWAIAVTMASQASSWEQLATICSLMVGSTQGCCEYDHVCCEFKHSDRRIAFHCASMIHKHVLKHQGSSHGRILRFRISPYPPLSGCTRAQGQGSSAQPIRDSSARGPQCFGFCTLQLSSASDENVCAFPSVSYTRRRSSYT